MVLGVEVLALHTNRAATLGAPGHCEFLGFGLHRILASFGGRLGVDDLKVPQFVKEDFVEHEPSDCHGRPLATPFRPEQFRRRLAPGTD